MSIDRIVLAFAGSMIILSLALSYFVIDPEKSRRSPWRGVQLKCAA